MNTVVYKYSLAVTAAEPIIPMPPGAKVLHAAVQNGVVCVWALVDPTTTKRENRHFLVLGTGHHCEAERMGPYIGTVHLHDGQLVLHVFEALS